MYQDITMKKVVRTWRGRWLPAVLLLALTAGFVAAAEPNPVVLDGAAASNDQQIDPNQAQVDPNSGLIKFIAFQKDMNIKDSLRLLAALCKKNIVPSAGVEGPLTISRLYNVTFEKALDAVLGTGFKYEQDGDFVRVYTVEEYKKIQENPERMEHKVITLYYITAEEADKLIKPVLSSAGSTVATTAAKKTMTSVSASSSGGSSGSSLSGEGSGDALALNDMLVILDYPENIQKAEDIIRKVDIRPKQVLVEATILSATLNENMEFGIDWNLLSGLPVTNDAINSGAGIGTPAETFGFAAPGGTTGLTVGFAAGNVRAVITALESVTDVTLLANPKILAVNKQEGIVQIGKTIGYRGSTTISTGGVASQGEVQFMPTGTVLVFRPFIGDDGYIRMDIYPQDSTATINPTTSVPDKTTAELRTNIMVKDGETVVIGGLFRDSITKTKSQVPVLGDLPLVGALFRGTLDTTSRQEVIIMLTPHIVSEPSETHAKERANDIRLKMQGAEKSLEAIDSAKIAEEAYAKAAKCYLEGDTEKALCYLKISLLARPTYLEALRLRERIIAETDPEQFKRLDSLAEQEVGKQASEGWSRR